VKPHRPIVICVSAVEWALLRRPSPRHWPSSNLASTNGKSLRMSPREAARVLCALLRKPTSRALVLDQVAEILDQEVQANRLLSPAPGQPYPLPPIRKDQDSLLQSEAHLLHSPHTNVAKTEPVRVGECAMSKSLAPSSSRLFWIGFKASGQPLLSSISSSKTYTWELIKRGSNIRKPVIYTKQALKKAGVTVSQVALTRL
jgi:hypothetical protein